MKARVKATGEIVEVAYLSEDKYGNKYYNVTTDTRTYRETELEMMSYKGDYFYTYDYWTRLEHQYAGMAMQGMIQNASYYQQLMETCDEPHIAIAHNARLIATTLVKKLKGEKQ